MKEIKNYITITIKKENIFFTNLNVNDGKLFFL